MIVLPLVQSTQKTRMPTPSRYVVACTTEEYCMSCRNDALVVLFPTCRELWHLGAALPCQQEGTSSKPRHAILSHVALAAVASKDRSCIHVTREVSAGKPTVTLASKLFHFGLIFRLGPVVAHASVLCTFRRRGIKRASLQTDGRRRQTRTS